MCKWRSNTFENLASEDLGRAEPENTGPMAKGLEDPQNGGTSLGFYIPELPVTWEGMWRGQCLAHKVCGLSDLIPLKSGGLVKKTAQKLTPLLQRPPNFQYPRGQESLPSQVTVS
ncbi:hypothetical protein KIL84_012818 [Mauremys mutica]|uniref:Uncharacterized protein n=1 Tax=Mauremys mutica TaxID=74926 RepID=A0A9D3XS90_9SAUR|nr:hypothetical protein KIL84_012818 [Mauremys mutica]